MDGFLVMWGLTALAIPLGLLGYEVSRVANALDAIRRDLERIKKASAAEKPGDGPAQEMI